MDPILTITTASSTTPILAYVGGLFTDFLPLLVLAIGLPLGFWVIKRVVGLVRARA